VRADRPAASRRRRGWCSTTRRSPIAAERGDEVERESCHSPVATSRERGCRGRRRPRARQPGCAPYPETWDKRSAADGRNAENAPTSARAEAATNRVASTSGASRRGRNRVGRKVREPGPRVEQGAVVAAVRNDARERGRRGDERLPAGGGRPTAQVKRETVPPATGEPCFTATTESPSMRQRSRGALGRGRRRAACLGLPPFRRVNRVGPTPPGDKPDARPRSVDPARTGRPRFRPRRLRHEGRMARSSDGLGSRGRASFGVMRIRRETGPATCFRDRETAQLSELAGRRAPRTACQLVAKDGDRVAFPLVPGARAEMASSCRRHTSRSARCAPPQAAEHASD